MLRLLLQHREDCGIADGEKAQAVDTRRKITDRGLIVALVIDGFLLDWVSIAMTSHNV